MKPLYKTTIVIWREDPFMGELLDLAWQATEGDAYCARMDEFRVDDPEQDNDWDGTEFFGEDGGVR